MQYQVRPHRGRKKKTRFPSYVLSTNNMCIHEKTYKWVQQNMEKREQERLNIGLEVDLNAGNEHQLWQRI